MKQSFLSLCLLGISLSASYAATCSVANPDALILPPFFGQGAPAQGPPANGQRPPKGGGSNQLQDLDLTAKQKTKVEAIMKKQRQEMDALRQNNAGTTDRETMKTSMRRLEADTDAQLKEVLTAEQYTKYQAKRKERPQQPKDGEDRPTRRTEN